MKREPRDELLAEAALRECHALVGEERRAAEWAVELVVVEPAVEASAVEDVAAGEHADLVAVLEGGLAHDAGVVVVVVVVAGGGAVVMVEELAAEGELIGEHDKSGEAGSDGGEEALVDDLVGVESAET